jgi:hypothetical protein
MSGSNYAMTPQLYYGEWYQCGDIIFDYWGDSGANGSFSGSYGSIEKLSMFKVIGGIGGGYDQTTITSVGKLEWFCIPNGDTTGNNPDIKLGTPNNVPVSGVAPIFYQTNTSLTFIGVNSTATEIWDDYTLPTNYPLLTNSRNYSAGNRTYRRTVTFTLKDSSASDLTDVTVYVKSGSNELVNAVQSTSTFSQKLRVVWVDWTSRSPASGSYIAPIQTIDNRDHVAQVRKYGYQQQSVSYTLTNAAYSQPFFMLAESSLSGISEATASAITTAGINWTTKTITPTGNLSYKQINARIAWELAQTTGSAYADPRTIVGSKLTLTTGWSLVVNAGITITSDTVIDSLYCPNIAINGSGAITGLYETTVGKSTIIEQSSVTAGSSIYVGNNATGISKQFQANTSASTIRTYFAPSETTDQLVVRELFGFQRVAQIVSLTGGLIKIPYVDIPDVGISASSKAIAQAYTSVETVKKSYDAVALFRLAEQGIKIGQLFTRNGTAVDIAAPYLARIKQDAAALVVVLGNTLYLKAPSYAADDKYDLVTLTPPATLTADTNEVITVEIQDANGDSSLTIQGGSGSNEIWKVPNGTPEDDYSTAGTKLADVGTGKWRFTGTAGFYLLVRDKVKNNRDTASMAKGTYIIGLYAGKDQITVAQLPEVYELQDDMAVVKLELEAIQGTGFTKDTHSLVNIKSNAAELIATLATIPQAIWGYVSRTLTSSGASGATIEEIEASTVLAKEATLSNLPTAAETASAVRTELATELAHLDANVSSRSTLSEIEGSLILAMKADVSAVDAKVDVLPLLSEIESSTILAKEITVASKLDASAYTAPDNASLLSVKATVENLPNLSVIEGSTVLAKESTSQAIKAKVDTLNNPDLSGLATHADVVVINNGIKKASKLIPHKTDI